MVLQLSQFFPLCSPQPVYPFPSAIVPLVVVVGHEYKVFGFFTSYSVLDVPVYILYMQICKY